MNILKTKDMGHKLCDSNIFISAPPPQNFEKGERNEQ